VPLWLFWLALVNLAIGFYWPVSVYILVGSQQAESCFRYETVSLFALNLAALSLREGAGWAKITWMDRTWSASLLLTAALLPATTEVTYEICRSWDPGLSTGFSPCAVVVYGALILAVVFYFGRVRPSLPALALATLNACWGVTVLAARVVFAHNNNGAPISGQWLFMGILVLAIFGGGVFLLRWASRFISSSP